VSDAVLIPPAGGEIVGDSADRRVEILSDDETLHSTWSRFAAGRDGADLHVHRQHTDMFYVLEGELTVRLGTEGETAAVPAGTLARVPPLVVHGFRNASSAEMRYLNFHAPGRGFADYLRSIRDGAPITYDQHPPPDNGGRPTRDAVVGGAATVADGVDLLADVDEVGIAEIRSEPGAPAPPAHLHRKHVESFYVLEGALTFTVNGSEIHAGVGTWVQIPAGVAHAFAPSGEGPARFLDVHTPSRGFGAFVRALHRAQTDEERAAARAAFDQV
jgi:mannose-6-phosphate isomerase-like protein (cupin superfamily)